ncbi:uncharacterized protein LOC131685350 [Topomyia yanbarensis]|uniref:uncharacterized protein LOC131685350 n=1 Tax=Topomyia yanbarensis TaxID=2498891 RepID=UPI00273C05A7|nr:uncharacterized protein LOC131685350 [Topomyia yanbarensis]
MSDHNPPGRNTNHNSTNSISKRPRLLSFQGPSTESATVERPPMAAGPSSSSLEEINVRQPALAAPDLASWQEAQIAACIEDNTINMVLEQYISFYEARHNGVEAEMIARAEIAEMEHQQEVLIEDRAIMAAISERGLQPVQVDGDGNSDEESVDNVPGAIPMGAAGQRAEVDGQDGIDLLESAVVAAIQEKGLTNAVSNECGQMEDGAGS